jgi:hypothetical protein
MAEFQTGKNDVVKRAHTLWVYTFFGEGGWGVQFNVGPNRRRQASYYVAPTTFCIKG